MFKLLCGSRGMKGVCCNMVTGFQWQNKLLIKILATLNLKTEGIYVGSALRIIIMQQRLNHPTTGLDGDHKGTILPSSGMFLN